MYTVYILQNLNDTYYIGHTNSMIDRLKRHNTNRSRFTKNKGPWELIYSEEYNSRPAAMKREMQLKKWNRNSLDRLIKTKI